MTKNKENFFMALILFAAFSLGWGASDCADVLAKCDCEKNMKQRNYRDMDMEIMRNAVQRRMQGRTGEDWADQGSRERKTRKQRPGMEN